LSLGRLTTRPTSKGRSAESVAESAQRSNRRDLARTGSGGKVLESVHPGLNVADGHRAQRLAHKVEEIVDVGGVGALGVLAAAVEPQVQELLVAVDLSDGRQLAQTGHPFSATNYVGHNRYSRDKRR
jgi:hypothetical protein